MTKDEVLKLALGALEDIANETYDPSTNGAKAQLIAQGLIPSIKEALAQPVWFSLTEEDKDSLLFPFGYYWVIEAIEAKLKEKNGV